MIGAEYVKMLVEEFHSTTAATLDENGRPVTRVIDMMLWDDEGVYFLTAKGKNFYAQLMEQKYLAISATKEKRAVSLHGYVKNIGSEKLDAIFEKNTYMQKIYPEGTRDALEVFVMNEAEGEYFDISDPSHIVRASIVIGKDENEQHGYFITDKCIRCGTCLSVCPQQCISLIDGKTEIDAAHCLHCGRCANVCPVQAIEKR